MIGIIGGSGLGQAIIDQLTDVRTETVKTPFGSPSDVIRIGRLGDGEAAFLNRHGPGHCFNPSRVPYAANIFALKKIGVTTLITSAAVGSLRQDYAPKQLVLVDQFIDKTFRRQNTFFDALGAVHCEMAQPCCGRLRKRLQDAATQIHTTVHPTGTYVCMEGPQFSTRAESLMHQKWGGDLIGMTAMPEAKLAREAQMCYALVALVSDYDCWQEHHGQTDKQLLLREIIGNLNAATDNAISLIKAVLAAGDSLCKDACPCRKSLEMAVWTSPAAMDPQTKDQLSVLFR
jgi:5'-methylthioadenosine phosphorylase